MENWSLVLVGRRTTYEVEEVPVVAKTSLFLIFQHLPPDRTFPHVSLTISLLSLEATQYHLRLLVLRSEQQSFTVEKWKGDLKINYFSYRFDGTEWSDMPDLPTNRSAMKIMVLPDFRDFAMSKLGNDETRKKWLEQEKRITIEKSGYTIF